MTLQRAALLYLLLSYGFFGVWALCFPAQFYAHFPGFAVWVSGDGPYNEHLTRDVGGLNLSLCFAAGTALLKPQHVAPAAVAGMALIFAVPHLTYHLGHLHAVMGEWNRVSSVLGLLLSVIVPLLLLPSSLTAPREGRK